MRWVAAAVEKDGSLDLFFFKSQKSRNEDVTRQEKKKKKEKSPTIAYNRWNW